MPENDQIWPRIDTLSFWARPSQLVWCPVGGLVDCYGTRAVSRKTPIYFILYTGLGRKWGAREKMKRRSVNGVPNVPNLLVSFFVAQKEVANSKLHIPMNDTHFILNQKYFRNLKKGANIAYSPQQTKYFPSRNIFRPCPSFLLRVDQIFSSFFFPYILPSNISQCISKSFALLNSCS